MGDTTGDDGPSAARTGALAGALVKGLHLGLLTGHALLLVLGDGVEHPVVIPGEDLLEQGEVVVKVGQIVKVRVIDVDIARNRISLSMKSGKGKTVQTKTRISSVQRTTPMNAMASAFAKLKR